MTTTLFFSRPAAEQDIIRKAYEFELEAIRTDSAERNPYVKAIQAMGLWDAFNEAVEMAFAAPSP